MKKRKLFSLIALIMALGLTACGDGDEKDASQNVDTINLAVVGTIRSNMSTLPINHAIVQDSIYEACYHWGNVSFVKCDGSPKVVASYRINEPDHSYTKAKHKSMAAECASELRSIAGQLTAEVEQTDCLEAIRKAGYELSSNGDGQRIMLVLDSGLSTTGYLDFTSPGLLDTDPQTVLAALEKAHALPHLDGIEVVWLGCAEVAPPQSQLNQAEQNNLEDIWRTIIEAAGGTATFLPGVSSGVPADHTTLPKVDLVQTSARDLEPFIPTQVLSGEEVAFDGDKATFCDPVAAKQAIRAVADSLDGCNNQVIILGGTAGGDHGTAQLAEDRAQAVADVLVAMGIEPGRLRVIGLAGADSPFYHPDLDQDGQQIESIASQNRTVRIIDANSPDAALLQ